VQSGSPHLPRSRHDAPGRLGAPQTFDIVLQCLAASQLQLSSFEAAALMAATDAVEVSSARELEGGSLGVKQREHSKTRRRHRRVRALASERLGLCA
jgi:hypothetical protein